MLEGKVRAALRYLSDHVKNGVLSLDDTLDSDESEDLDNALLLQGPIEEVNAIIFDQLDATAIRNAALHTQGAAGVSGLDAIGWRRLCCSFKGASHDLCNAIASLARRLAMKFVDPLGLHAFTACRLIPLNKNPGVRPISIAETLRRITAKAILAVVKQDVQTAAGSLQVCAGQEGGCEAAVHAMRQVFHAADDNAVLLVDASNAFNSTGDFAQHPNSVSSYCNSPHQYL